MSHAGLDWNGLRRMGPVGGQTPLFHPLRSRPRPPWYQPFFNSVDLVEEVSGAAPRWCAEVASFVGIDLSSARSSCLPADQIVRGWEVLSGRSSDSVLLPRTAAHSPSIMSHIKAGTYRIPHLCGPGCCAGKNTNNMSAPC